MARLTFDAVIVQSVIGVGEKLQLAVLAVRAFGSESPVAVLRTQRAAAVLSSWDFVEIEPPVRAREVRSNENPQAPGIQLWACITRMIRERLTEEAA